MMPDKAPTGRETRRRPAEEDCMNRMAWGVRQERLSVSAASDPLARNVARDMGVPYTPAASMAANGMELVYDAFGDLHAPPLLLIAGLAAPMIGWDERFCAKLALRGYRVIRFDNRDTGLSSYCPRFGVPNIRDLYAAKDKGIPVAVPYTLGDMAEDAVGLLNGLGIESAHIVGTCTGGAVAQEMAIHWPRRLRTLTSIMSSTGDPGLPGPTPEAEAVFRAPMPMDRDGFCRAYAERWKVLRGPGFPKDEAADVEKAQRVFARGCNPPGVSRQFAATIASPGRGKALANVRLPTLVIHGDADPLVPVQGGIATAKAIPGATLRIVEGMGHALPMVMWPSIVEMITEHAR